MSDEEKEVKIREGYTPPEPPVKPKRDADAGFVTPETPEPPPKPPDEED